MTRRTLELCWAIERIPGCKEQTDAAVMASEVDRYVQGLEAELEALRRPKAAAQPALAVGDGLYLSVERLLDIIETCRGALGDSLEDPERCATHDSYARAAGGLAVLSDLEIEVSNALRHAEPLDAPPKKPGGTALDCTA